MTEPQTATLGESQSHRRFHVLVPISDNRATAEAQARFVAALPDPAETVTATLTHVLHDEELDAQRELRSAQRVGAVVHARDYLEENSVPVQIVDVDELSSPALGILTLGDKLDADLIVLGGGMHGFLEDLLTGDVARSVGQRTDRPLTIVPETYAGTVSE